MAYHKKNEKKIEPNKALDKLALKGLLKELTNNHPAAFDKSTIQPNSKAQSDFLKKFHAEQMQQRNLKSHQSTLLSEQEFFGGKNKTDNFISPNYQPQTILPKPIAVIADYFEQQCWPFEKYGEHELLLDIAGEWCRYRFYFMWLPEKQFFYTSVKLDMRLPDYRHEHYSFLIQKLNETMHLGHVDLSPNDLTPIWRNSMPLRGFSSLTYGQLEDLLAQALVECDRIYPAFQLFVWGKFSAEDAIATVMFPCEGFA